MIPHHVTLPVQSSDRVESGPSPLDDFDEFLFAFERDHPVPETLPFGVAADHLVDRTAEARAILHGMNARKATPDPVCEVCDFVFSPGDGGLILTHVCFSCEADRLFGLVWDLITAEGFRGWLRATFALMRLRRMARA